jgi:hypothetical protein
VVGWGRWDSGVCCLALQGMSQQAAGALCMELRVEAFAQCCAIYLLSSAWLTSSCRNSRALNNTGANRVRQTGGDVCVEAYLSRYLSRGNKQYLILWFVLRQHGID